MTWRCSALAEGRAVLRRVHSSPEHRQSPHAKGDTAVNSADRVQAQMRARDYNSAMLAEFPQIIPRTLLHRPVEASVLSP